jgi:Ca-activated chloride channel homolog
LPRIRRFTVYTVRFWPVDMVENINTRRHDGTKKAATNKYLIAAFLVLSCLCVLVFAQQQTLKVDVNLINVFVTVKDDRGRFVSNLTKDDFRLYEDGQLQEIQIFEKQDKVDSSIGILIDTSGSMVDIMPYMKRGIRDFTRVLPKADEFFVVSFGSTVKLLHTSSESQKHLDESMTNLRAWGTSSLFDGLLYAMSKLEKSSRPRKALIAFTDGNDNGSNVSQSRVVEEVQSSAVLLYFIAIGSPVLVDSHTLEPLSDLSGGRTLYVPKQDAVSPVLDQIREELSHQYYLGYYAPRREGSHQLRVEIPGQHLRIRAKTGYVG